MIVEFSSVIAESVALFANWLRSHGEQGTQQKSAFSRLAFAAGFQPVDTLGDEGPEPA